MVADHEREATRRFETVLFIEASSAVVVHVNGEVELLRAAPPRLFNRPIYEEPGNSKPMMLFELVWLLELHCRTVLFDGQPQGAKLNKSARLTVVLTDVESVSGIAQLLLPGER